MVSNSFNVEHVAANVANVSDICFVGGPWGPLANHAATSRPPTACTWLENARTGVIASAHVLVAVGRRMFITDGVIAILSIRTKTSIRLTHSESLRKK